MTEPKCIDLRERFGQQWRIEYEESHYADHGERTRTEDPWLMIIPCQHGHICPWGDDLLAACTNNRGTIAKRLKTLPFVAVVQDGDDGINASFHVDHFEEVAAIMRPKRKRPPRTESQRRATERLRDYHFKPGKKDAYTTLESPAGPRRVSEHVRTAERPF